MLLLNDNRADRQCLVMRDHGRAPGDPMFWNRAIGHGLRMSSMQAALGTAQLEHLPELIEDTKHMIFDWYRRALGICPPSPSTARRPMSVNAYWMVTVVLDPR